MSNYKTTATVSNSPYYLPVDSRVAVRDSAGNLQWYTTKKEVPLTGEEATVRCPMRDDRDVLTTTHQGCEVYFLPTQRRIRLESGEVKAAGSLELYQLVYDIPTGRGIPSPCPWLYPIAIRINLSCWIVPKDRIPYTRLNTLTEMGANWHLTKFDASEARNLVERAIDSITAEMRDTVTRATEAEQDAEILLTGERASPNPNTARKNYIARLEQIRKRCETTFKNLESAAGIFGINTNRLNQQSARNSVEAINAGMRQRAAAYAAGINAVRATGNQDAPAMAAAVSRNEVPAGVVADYLADNGNQAQADAIQAAFSEDHTFSLASADSDDNNIGE